MQAPLRTDGLLLKFIGCLLSLTSRLGHISCLVGQRTMEYVNTSRKKSMILVGLALEFLRFQSILNYHERSN